MKPILLLKTGGAQPALVEQKGDFEHWIMAGMNLPSERFRVLDIEHGAPLPSHTGWAGVVISGSHAMVTDHLPWSEQAAQWLAIAIDINIPILGICYGHQLLAHALGGQVGNRSDGLDYGTAEVQLQPDSAGDALFGNQPETFLAQVCHSQSVISLPEGAKLLAKSVQEGYMVFKIGEVAWGVQFHPEFDREVMAFYIESDRDELQAQGQDPKLLVDACQDTPQAAKILARFANLTTS